MEELSHGFEEIFRRDKGRVVGALVRRLGSLDAAEEAFQEAVLAAIQSWPAKGTPLNPAAWLTTAARNHARDAARHRRIVADKAPLLREDEAVSPDVLRSIPDDELRLIFTCCHPVLTLDSQVALTLKVVSGFTTDEIARAFVSPEKRISQRIVRAKRMIEDAKVSYAVPERAELPARLDAVLTVVYLLFNEGHTPREGALVRPDLQAAAIRLCRSLCDLLPMEPEVFGLYALIAFGVARTSTRTENGDLVQLPDQDRSRWDRATIKEALLALQRARRLGGRESFVLQAEIAACHVTATTWDATDWGRILHLYDALLAVAPSPVVALNRAVALAMHRGPAEGIVALATLEPELASYHLFYAVRADLRSRLGENARDDYRRAFELATNAAERRHLQQKMNR